MADSPSVQPASDADERTPNDRRMFGILRGIRGAVQQLQGLIGQALSDAATAPPAGRNQILCGGLPTDSYGRIDRIVSPGLQDIGKIFEADVSEFEWCSDNVVVISLQWGMTKDLWPDSSTSFDDNQSRITRLRDCLDQIVYQCGALSISPRVNDMMKNLRVGQPLDFEFAFGPELPENPDLRKRLLLELAQESGAIESGVVDINSGVIYKAARSRKVQRRSAFVLAAILIAGSLIPFALAGAGKLVTDWPFAWTDWKRLLEVMF